VVPRRFASGSGRWLTGILIGLLFSGVWVRMRWGREEWEEDRLVGWLGKVRWHRIGFDSEVGSWDRSG